MFQSDFENNSDRHSEGRAGKVAFVVGDPAEAQAAAARSDGTRQPGADEENIWMSDRLTGCYND